MAGNRGEKPKAGPYARVYGPWIDELARRHIGGQTERVFLKLCQVMRPGGDGAGYIAWYSAKDMADELGTTPGTISNHLGKLSKAGVIEVYKRSHPGFSTVYRIMPGIRWPDAKPDKGKGPEDLPRLSDYD